MKLGGKTKALISKKHFWSTDEKPLSKKSWRKLSDERDGKASSWSLQQSNAELSKISFLTKTKINSAESFLLIPTVIVLIWIIQAGCLCRETFLKLIELFLRSDWFVEEWRNPLMYLKVCIKIINCFPINDGEKITSFYRGYVNWTPIAMWTSLRLGNHPSISSKIYKKSKKEYILHNYHHHRKANQ